MLDVAMRRRQKLRNAVQTLLLIGAMVVTLALLAWLLLGAAGLLWILMLGALAGVAHPEVSSRWLLAMYGAEPLPTRAAPSLHRLVRILAERADLPAPPALYYLPSPVSNAFTVGRGQHAAIAVTEGLLRRLTRRQIAGVLAHEISHVRAGDTTVMTLTDLIGRLVYGLCYAGILTQILATPTSSTDTGPLLISVALVSLPTLVTLLQLALSRSREYDADLEAVALTHDPHGLAGALESLEPSTGGFWERPGISGHRIIDPVLLRTHPPTQERARRLRALAVPNGPRPWPAPRPMYAMWQTASGKDAYPA